MAPETRGAIVAFDEKADVYSFAMVLSHLFTHCVPFAEFGDRADWHIERCIERANLRPSLAGVPSAMRQLIVDCWQTRPEARPSFISIVDRLLEK